MAAKLNSAAAALGVLAVVVAALMLSQGYLFSNILTLTNDTPRQLSSVRLSLADDHRELGLIQPGASRSVRMHRIRGEASYDIHVTDSGRDTAVSACYVEGIPTEQSARIVERDGALLVECAYRGPVLWAFR